MSIESNRYFFVVVAIRCDFESLDFMVAEEGSLFSTKLWEEVEDLASHSCSVSRLTNGYVQVAPRYEFPCPNSYARPDFGDEEIPSARVPPGVHIGIIDDLPGRIYVSETFLLRVAGHGFTGIGFLEVEDEEGLRRATYSFNRELKELSKKDNLIKEIVSFCRRTGNALLSLTLAEENYEFDGKACRGIWYVTSIGPELALEKDNCYYFLNEFEQEIGRHHAKAKPSEGHIENNAHS